jgi:hypothetical protein
MVHSTHQCRRTLRFIRHVNVGTLVAVAVGGGAGGGSRVQAARAGNERYQSMLISSQQIAIVASIKHQGGEDFRQQMTIRPARGKQKSSVLACCIPISRAANRRAGPWGKRGPTMSVRPGRSPGLSDRFRATFSMCGCLTGGWGCRLSSDVPNADHGAISERRSIRRPWAPGSRAKMPGPDGPRFEKPV